MAPPQELEKSEDKMIKSLEMISLFTMLLSPTCLMANGAAPPTITQPTVQVKYTQILLNGSRREIVASNNLIPNDCGVGLNNSADVVTCLDSAGNQIGEVRTNFVCNGSPLVCLLSTSGGTSIIKEILSYKNSEYFKNVTSINLISKTATEEFTYWSTKRKVPTLDDARIPLKITAGLLQYSAAYKDYDVDQNGVVDLRDAILLQKLTVGLPVDLPANSKWESPRRVPTIQDAAKTSRIIVGLENSDQNYDLDGDGKLTMQDAIEMQKACVGLINPAIKYSRKSIFKPLPFTEYKYEYVISNESKVSKVIATEKCYTGKCSVVINSVSDVVNVQNSLFEGRGGSER